MRRCSLVWIAVAACYGPQADRDCTIACDFAGAGAGAACPDGLTCASSGFCIDERSATTCAATDAGTDDGGSLCFGTGPDVACFAAPPSGAIVVGNVSTDTCDDGAHMQVGGAATCVIAGATISVPSNIIAQGSLRLMLVGTQSIMINAGAGIDVSASQGGAASSATICAASVNATMASGGGAGGSFDGLGGNGLGAGAGTRGVNVVPAFRTGCAGGTSGTTAGGKSGGAIYLVSEGQIIVGGAINASGSGGGGGMPGNGGGGGGSGGFIGLDAPAITIGGNARLLAAGGGGGAGGDTFGPGHQGGAGGDPTIAQPVGAGGTVPDGGTGGPGGIGSSLTDLDGQNGGAPSLNGQGGGGGGGAGVIEFFKAATECVPPTCVPFRIVP